MGIGPVGTLKEFDKFLRKKKIYHKTAEAVGKKYFKHMLDKKIKLELLFISLIRQQV